MSLVLAPIHDIMYQKVLRQDRMTEALLKKNDETNWDDSLRAQADQAAPAAKHAPLADIIDQTNIHGWLDQAVKQSEKRFALVAARLLKNHPERFLDMRESLYTLGAQEQAPAAAGANDAYQWLGSALLDGMPCDRTIEVDEAGPEETLWHTARCSHTPHWVEQGLSADLYYQLRDAWINGAMAQSGFTYDRKGTAHRLQKES